MKLSTKTVHLAVWISFSLINIGPLLFKHEADVITIILKTLSVSAAVFYINVLWLLPKFLFQNKLLHYLGYTLLAATSIISIVCLIDNTLFDIPLADSIVEWILPVLGMLFVSTTLGYLDADKKARKREIDLTHQNIEFEMKFLKSQINPHFLFNALNNIYALSVIKSDRTPDMILKLSDMLRFTLYDSESQKVKVSREIDYIINFIEFQKLKMDSEPNIKLDTSNCNNELLIEPMLMIPFIENSFKHGNIENTKKGWLQVEIKTLGPILIFKVKNSLPAITINKDVVGGIGVENVRKRLDILYPNRYELNIETTENAFSIFMKIDTFAG
jgi:sensor histidine kinase YesM